MRRRRPSIRVLLILLVLSISLPGVLLIASLAAASVDQATEQTRDGAAAAARLVAATRAATYDRTASLLASVARRPRTANLALDACTEMPEPAAVDPAYAFLALYAPDGRAVCGSPVGVISWPREVAPAAWFQAALTGARGVVSRPFQGAPSVRMAYLIHLFQEMLEHGAKMHRVNTHGEYHEIDTTEDYALALEDWR